jgi:GNAT superfamily N-acetyltransferase
MRVGHGSTRHHADAGTRRFADAFVGWAHDVTATHTPFVAAAETVIGSAWLAVVPRAPNPGMAYRANGDLQTVLVAPGCRDQGLAEALVRAVLAYAWKHGVDAVTVAAKGRAPSLYRRVGFVGDPLDLRLTAPGPAAHRCDSLPAGNVRFCRESRYCR